MSHIFFKVFKNSDDNYKWNKQKEYAALVHGIDENTRLNLLTALDILEESLGKNFLKSSHFNHPVKQMIIEKTEFQMYELIEFANTLKALELTDSNFPKLIKKLLRKDRSRIEGVPFVEIAQKYIQEGFLVNFPEEDNRGRSPDIKIKDTDNNNVFFIEVSTLNDGPDKVIARNNHYFFHNQFHYIPPQNSFAGKQKNIITEEDYPEIKEIISDAKKKAAEQKQIVYYSDRRFHFIITPQHPINEFENFCQQNSLEINNICGLPLTFDETNRIINNKIKNKAGQIPIGFNGLIYFSVSPLFFITTDIKKSIKRIEEHLSNFTNIIGIVIYSKIVDGSDETVVNMNKHLYSKKIMKNLSCESLFIHNGNCEVIISDQTLKKIYRTF